MSAVRLGAKTPRQLMPYLQIADLALSWGRLRPHVGAVPDGEMRGFD